MLDECTKDFDFLEDVKKDEEEIKGKEMQRDLIDLCRRRGSATTVIIVSRHRNIHTPDRKGQQESITHHTSLDQCQKPFQSTN